MRLIPCAALALMLAPQTGAAQNYAAGESAYQSGDYSAAMDEWRPLAEQGNVTAQLQIGWLYDNGKGVTRDQVEAARWYRLAAEQGHEIGQFNTGLMYEKGLGVRQDHAEATRWYRLAAEQGHKSAQFNLGVMYYGGKGVTKDYTTAYIWFSIAATNGVNGAVRARDIVQRRMSPSDLSRAKGRVRECIEADFQNCG